MAPEDTVWSLDPHTLGKHRVLKRYMEAWLPIMASRNERILFVDGFAGPGEYQGGEPGSPLIVLDALTTHASQKMMRAQINFLFIEEDAKRAEHLEATIANAHPDLPTNCTRTIVKDTFNNAIANALGDANRSAQSLPPAFVMIDPFGVKGVHMTTISRLLHNIRTEVYVSFMYESMNRWLNDQSFEPHLDELFGCEDWKDARDIIDPTKRKSFLFGLFRQQLKSAGAKYVVYFELYRGNRLVYAIFFATSNLLGCQRMKEAIWTVTDSTYAYQGDLGDQMSFGDDFVDMSAFRKELRLEFGTRDSVTIEELSDFAMSDRTRFHKGHLKQKTLSPMEKDGELKVVEDTRRRKRTFPDGTKIRFTKP